MSNKNERLLIPDCVEIVKQGNTVFVTYLDGAEISVEKKAEMHEAFLKITGEEKHFFVFESAGSLWYSKEAREYSRSIEHKQPYRAVAMVAPQLGFRLLSEFYARIYKPEVPYLVVKTVQDAEKWFSEF
jgi:hypothetical protein